MTKKRRPKSSRKAFEERINAKVDQVHVDDATTTPALPIFGNPDYAKSYDLVIHDECAAGYGKVMKQPFGREITGMDRHPGGP